MGQRKFCQSLPRTEEVDDISSILEVNRSLHQFKMIWKEMSVRQTLKPSHYFAPSQVNTKKWTNLFLFSSDSDEDDSLLCLFFFFSFFFFSFLLFFSFFFFLLSYLDSYREGIQGQFCPLQVNFSVWKFSVCEHNRLTVVPRPLFLHSEMASLLMFLDQPLFCGAMKKMHFINLWFK